MAISTELLEEMKTRLSEEKSKLESSLSRFAKPTQAEGNYEATFEEIGTDDEENATEVEMYADNIALEENLETQLSGVTAALARIDAGTYGVCNVCGKDIEEGRLKAFPSADDCMEHAK